MKKKLLIALGALLCLMVLVVLGGFLLDGNVLIETEATLSAPPATVFAVLNTYDGQEAWWTEAVKAYAEDGMPPMEMTHRGGPKAGTGMQLDFLYDGTLAEEWEVLASEGPTRIVYNVDFQMFVVERTLTLSPSGSGTAVHWSDAGYFGNPLMRYMTLMPKDTVRGNFDRALVALDHVTAPDATP